MFFAELGQLQMLAADVGSLASKAQGFDDEAKDATAVAAGALTGAQSAQVLPDVGVDLAMMMTSWLGALRAAEQSVSACVETYEAADALGAQWLREAGQVSAGQVSVEQVSPGVTQ